MIQSQHLDYETGMITVEITLREQYPNTQFIWSSFSNAGKHGPEKLRIWTIFMQCYCNKL